MPLGPGGEGAFPGQRRRIVADVHHRRLAVGCLYARHEVVNELARVPDLEGIEPELAPARRGIAWQAFVVGREQNQRAAGSEVRDLVWRSGMGLAVRAGRAELIALGRDRVFHPLDKSG